MDQFTSDILSFQSKIRRLNEYGVHVLFPASNVQETSPSVENPEVSIHIIDNEKSHSDPNCTQVSLKGIQNNVQYTVADVRDGKLNEKLFTLKPGLNVCPFGKSPIDYFCVMANEDMFKCLLEETNKNLYDMREENGSDEAHDLTLHELIRFIGLLLHMGTIQLNRIVDYWKDDPLFGITCFPRYMTRNRFMILLKCLQHSNLIVHFNTAMTKCYTSGRTLTAKEPLYYIDGRLRKRLSVLPDNVVSLHSISEPNGVIVKCAVTSNKCDENIVIEMLSDLVDCHRSVFVSQSYSSVRLAHKLLERATTCTGILPNDTLRLSSMNQEKPLIGIIQKGVLIGRWKRDNTVFFSSSHSEIENVSEEETPKALEEFYRYMSDDKLNDELLAYYTCERRQMCIEKKVVIHILQLMLMNAYYLFNRENECKSTLYDFRLDVIKSLVDSDITKWSREDGNLSLDHQPCLLRQDSLGRFRRKKCHICYYQNGIRKDTQYYCPNCPNLPGLCRDSCFRLYHTLINTS